MSDKKIIQAKINTQIKIIRLIKWVIIGVVLFGLSKLGYNYRKSQTIQNLVITVEHNDNKNELLKEDVLREIEESFGFDLTGSSIELLDLKNIEAVVREYDFVREAEVFLDADHNIHVDIIPRNALARIFDQKGGHYFLDDTGAKIEADGDIKCRVPVVTGIIGPYERDEEGMLLGGLHEIFLLCSQLVKDPFMSRLVEQIYVKNNYEIVLFSKIGQEDIQFGRAEDIEVKFRKLKKFYEGGIRYKGFNQYKEIDLRFKDQVITKSA